MPNELYSFNKLALGTRFSYHMQLKVWVKIGVNTIAEWDDKYKTDSWVGQQICCFAEADDGLAEEVIVL